MFRNNRGDMLFNIMAGIVVMSIIAGAGLSSMGKTVDNSNKSTVENDMNVMVSNLEIAVNEIGLFTTESGMSTDEKGKIYMSYMNRVDAEYSNLAFNLGDFTTTEVDETELIIMSDGFYVYTKTLDSWGTPYRLYYRDNGSLGKVFAILSAGPNQRHESFEVNSPTFKIDKYDDIICLINIKDVALDRDVSFDRFM